MADQLSINSLQDDVQHVAFTQKDWYYILDQNGGQFGNNQILFDSMGTSNSGQWIIWAESYIVVPVLIAVTYTAAAMGNMPMAAGFKNGYYQLVSQMNIILNSKTLSNNAMGTNILANFRVLTEWSPSALKLKGVTLCVSPDTSDAGTYVAGAVGTAHELNNITTPALSFNTGGGGATFPLNSGAVSCYNSGLNQRILWNSYSASTAGVGQSTLVTKNAASAGFRNYTEFLNVNVGAQFYYIMATIPMCYLHDLFKQMRMPLRNLHWQLYIGVCQGNTTITPDATNVVVPRGDVNVRNSVPNFTGNCCPVMISAEGSCYQNAANAATNVAICVGGSLTAGNAGTRTAPATSCRLYYPVVQLPPALENKIITHDYKRVIRYWDHQLFGPQTVTASGGSINWMATNGISNLKRVIIFPTLQATANDGVDPLYSCLTTEPGTTSQDIILTNLQLFINGKSFFANNISAQYENFYEFFRQECLNGGDDDGIASGLIDQYAWQRQYCYYVFNVSRNPTIVSPDVPCSIMLAGTNQTAAALNLYMICEYECAVLIDMQSAATSVTKSFTTA